MNTRSLIVPFVLLQATLLVASGCATQPQSGAAPNASQTQQASAGCKVDAAHIGRVRRELSTEGFNTRNDLFARICASPGARLVDVSDPTLAGRLLRPEGFQYSKQPQDYYPPLAQFLGVHGDVLMGLVVEVDGSIHDVTVLESSGNQLLDTAGVKFVEEARYKTPAMLDGRPVRAFFYQTFKWRLD